MRSASRPPSFIVHRKKARRTVEKYGQIGAVELHKVREKLRSDFARPLHSVGVITLRDV